MLISDYCLIVQGLIFFKASAHGGKLVNDDQNVQECDASMFNSYSYAGFKKKFFIIHQ